MLLATHPRIALAAAVLALAAHGPAMPPGPLRDALLRRAVTPPGCERATVVRLDFGEQLLRTARQRRRC